MGGEDAVKAFERFYDENSVEDSDGNVIFRIWRLDGWCQTKLE